MSHPPSHPGFLRLLAAVLLGSATMHAADPAPSRWEPRIVRLLNKDKVSPPPLGAVLFAGSSSLEMWLTIEADFPSLTLINRGIGGTQLADWPDYADRLVLPFHPRILVVYAGENDLADGRTVEDVVAAFAQVKREFFAAEPGARMIFLALKPSPRRRALLPQMREANQRIAAACATDPRCTFVDVFTPMLDAAGEPRAELFSADNLHMNAAGYRLWTGLLSPVIARVQAGVGAAENQR